MQRLVKACKIAAWCTRIGHPQKSPVSGSFTCLQVDPAYPKQIVLDRISRNAVSAASDRKPPRPGPAEGWGAGGLWEASVAFCWGDQPGRGREKAEGGP